jgi:hypothetical protein
MTGQLRAGVKVSFLERSGYTDVGEDDLQRDNTLGYSTDFKGVATLKRTYESEAPAPSQDSQPRHPMLGCNRR